MLRPVMASFAPAAASACAAPRAAVELYEAVAAGNHSLARDLQNRLAPLSQIVTAGLGVPALKVAIEIAGMAGGPPRRPLAPLGEQDRPAGVLPAGRG